ncbi:transporter, major facilitator family protein [Corynebacterium efficiens YS-314]|uniref:Putative transport protein n=1 Tax=Corynebacterium efficiens (strain DSM 44549 / YS-314 / AJ 12310 / JCM 11189 / NBRC 100395) TaxID=196164 RepID=Q8FRX2_COREF|nr:MFS transporter [Corynebacterium efficiens]EEW50309.1 transporter, major facilitator family protein [Corynebacterium efficiens YS-314]BAC17446.1 putative transport protein [Corynebacterium efficiens YS-314]
MDIRKTIDTTPMSGFQWYIVGLATFLNALDGYDVLAMAFTANAVSEEFGLNGSQLGLLLSAGLVGMALGSLILGPFADKLGRRRILIVSLLINLAGLALSATAGSSTELAIWRVVTGIGIGGILATVTVITSEYSNNKNRGMAVSIYTAGYGLGATLGGLLAARLIPEFGWRSVFLAGAAATLVSVILVVVSIPESVDYLRVKRPAGAEEKALQIARRIGKPDTIGLGTVNPADSAQAKLSDLLSGPFKVTTLKLWAAFFFIMFGFYFANSWTPKLLVESGMTENQGIIGGLALTLGGTFGSLIYGVITTRFNSRHTLMVFTVLSALTLVVFITTTSIPMLAFGSGVLVGMLINGCVAGLYTVTPASYPSALRTTGVGWGIGVGRFGAIFAPITVGALLDAGWTPPYLYGAVAVVVVLAAVALIGIRPYLGTEQKIAVTPAQNEAVPTP